MSEIKHYAVHMDVGASIVVEVDAASEEAAEDLAWAKARLPSVCHHCSRELDIHDFTGIITVEELEP